MDFIETKMKTEKKKQIYKPANETKMMLLSE